MAGPHCEGACGSACVVDMCAAIVGVEAPALGPLGVFGGTAAAFPLPRNGVALDMMIPPATARQPDVMANQLADIDTCNGEPGTVSP